MCHVLEGTGSLHIFIRASLPVNQLLYFMTAMKSQQCLNSARKKKECLLVGVKTTTTSGTLTELPAFCVTNVLSSASVGSEETLYLVTVCRTLS